MTPSRDPYQIISVTYAATPERDAGREDKGPVHLGSFMFYREQRRGRK